MRRFMVALAAVSVLSVPAASALSWDELLAERLQNNITYRQAVLQRQVAEQVLAQSERFYLPYVNVGVGPSGPPGSIVYNGDFYPISVRPSVAFTQVLGAEIAFELPITVDPSPSGQTASVGNPSLSVTRRMFEESDAELLGARADMIRSREAELSASADVRAQLASEVLDAWISLQTLEDARRRLELAERLRTASRDETVNRDLERSLLQAERSLIQAERALRTIDPRIIEHANVLYEEVGDRFALWIAGLPEPNTIPTTSAAIDAQELDLAAAEARRRRSFLPYVPNPTFSATLGYDRDGGEWYWALSLQFSIAVVDRGERALSALQRRESAEIERLRLESARDSFQNAVRNAWEELTLIDLDLQILRLDLESQQEAAAKTRSLFESGFATEETLITSELALSGAELQVARAENDYRMQQLRVSRYFIEWSSQ
jgi:outer membrane protein TolC